jgi:serine acetyltransferase
MPGIRIGRGSVIGSGAVAAKDAEPFTYNVGVPAKQVRERSSWTRSPTAVSPREAAFFEAHGFPAP